MENGKQPAHPVRTYKEFADDFRNGFKVWGGIDPTGLTKREQFAAMAMQGLLGDHTLALSKQEIAAIAVGCADELLKALES